MNEAPAGQGYAWLSSVELHEVPWPQPFPIQSELPPVEPLSEELLPMSLRPLVRDVAERMQTPLDYPAIVAVLCLAGAVNRRALMQPKANDTSWIVVPNLWGAIVAPPGFLKSPVITTMTRTLVDVQDEWRREQEEFIKEYTQQKAEYELRRAAWKKQYIASLTKTGAA